MGIERTKLSISSADNHPRPSMLAIGSVQVPVRDAIAALVFLGVIGASISMIPKSSVLPEPAERHQRDPNSLEEMRKNCHGKLISDGEGNFSCEPKIETPKKRGGGEGRNPDNYHLNPLWREDRRRDSAPVKV